MEKGSTMHLFPPSVRNFLKECVLLSFLTLKFKTANTGNFFPLKTESFLPGLILFILFGCGGKDSDKEISLDEIIAGAVKLEEIQTKGIQPDSLSYHPDSKTLFSGWSKSHFPNGEIKSLFAYKEGKHHGRTTSWYQNGNKREELLYESDRIMNAVVWKPTGEKCLVTQVVEGKGIILIYDHNGSENLRIKVRDGVVSLN